MEFYEGQTNNETIAICVTTRICAGDRVVTGYGNPVSSIAPHFNDKHYGIADFIGVEICEE